MASVQEFYVRVLYLDPHHEPSIQRISVSEQHDTMPLDGDEV